MAHLDFAAAPTPAPGGDKDRSPRLADRVALTPARLHDDPKPVTDAARLAGASGVFQFSGDNAVIHHGAPMFRRTDPFSIAIRLRPTERQDRAVVLHQSRAWTDAGSRGYEIVLDHGRPTFALTHFWPGNAVAVRRPAPAAARHVVDARRHLRRLEPRRRPAPLPGRDAARDRDASAIA